MWTSAKKAPKKLVEAQGGKTRSLHKAQKAPEKLAETQDGKTRSLCKAKKAPKKLTDTQEGKTSCPNFLGRRHMKTSCPAFLGVCFCQLFSCLLPFWASINFLGAFLALYSFFGATQEVMGGKEA